ncbi:MAG TPA: sulfite exporter TauE/SafE family protein [Gemmatimonadales bacterium]
MALLGYALAVVIGISLGLLGGGGAILTVPVLVYVMGIGVKQAVPTSLVIVGLTSFIGMLRHRTAGTVDARAAITFGPAAILGSLIGTRAALLVSPQVQLTVFAVVLLAAATMMLRPRREPLHPAPTRRPLPLILLLGTGVGFLTGFVGVGGGFMYVPALTLLAGLDMKTAVGTSLALIVLSSAAGVVGYLGQVHFDWVLVGVFAGLAFIGVQIGSMLVPKVPQERLRKWFAVLLLVMGVVVLLKR